MCMCTAHKYHLFLQRGMIDCTPCSLTADWSYEKAGDFRAFFGQFLVVVFLRRLALPTPPRLKHSNVQVLLTPGGVNDSSCQKHCTPMINTRLCPRK